MLHIKESISNLVLCNRKVQMLFKFSLFDVLHALNQKLNELTTRYFKTLIHIYPSYTVKFFTLQSIDFFLRKPCQSTFRILQAKIFVNIFMKNPNPN